MRNFHLRWTSGLAAALSLITAPARGSVSPGDILVVEEVIKAVVKIDRQTGARTILSSATVGTGTMFSEPHAIAVASDGSILVSDVGRDYIFKVDPNTGNRTILFDGSGGTLINAYGMTISRAGLIYLSDIGTNRLIRLNADGSGLTSIVNNGRFDSPNTIVLDSTETYIWVADSYESPNKTSYVERTKNAAFPLSSTTTISGGTAYGYGPSLGAVTGITLQSDSAAYVSCVAPSQILLVTAPLGIRSTVADVAHGSGPTLYTLYAVITDPFTGHLLVLNGNAHSTSVLDVDPATGNRTLISGPGQTGPTLDTSQGIVVYVYSAAAPTFTSRSDGVSWTPPASNWHLETRTSLTSGTWNAAYSNVQSASGAYFYPYDLSSQSGFFRLHLNP